MSSINTNFEKVYSAEKKKIARRIIATLLIVVSSAVAGARAQEAKPEAIDNGNASAAVTPAPTTPPPISLPDIVAASEDLSKKLGDMERDLNSDSMVGVIESQFPSLIGQIDDQINETNQVISARPSLETLRETRGKWSSARDQLPTWRRELNTRAAKIEQQIKELDKYRDTWQSTRGALDQTAVPGEVSGRVDAALAAIARTRAQIEARRVQILSLQNRVSEQEARVTAAINLLSQSREAVVNSLFVRDSAPIWSANEKFHTNDEMVNASRLTFAGQIEDFFAYVREHRGGFLLHFALIVAFAAGLYWVSRRARPWVAKEPSLKPAALIFDSFLTTAVLLSILVSGRIYPQAPRLLSGLLGAAALIPAVIVLRRLVERSLFPILNALVIFYVTDLLRYVTLPLPFIARAVFLAEMIGGILFLLWVIKSNSQIADADAEVNRVHRTVRRSSIVALFFFAAALVANVFGYVGIAQLIGNGILNSAYTAFILYAVARVLDGLVTFALRVRPLALLGMVERHRGLLRRRVRTVIRWVGVLLWALITLEIFAIREAVLGWVSRVLAAEFGVGTVKISLSGVIAFALTVWFTFLISRFLRFVLEEDVYPRLPLARGIPYAVSTVVNYLVLLAGFVFAIGALGFDLTRFTILAGAFGVGVGFGLQNIVNNFVSGLILLFERPVNVGDSIQLGEFSGDLRSIGLRASSLRTGSGSEVIVPNGDLISNKVVNWTRSDHKRRMEINVGVAYGTRPEEVLELLRGVAKGHGEVLDDPAPQALFVGFGEYALNFQLLAWTDQPEQLNSIKSDLMVGVNAALRQADIAIPVPHRDVTAQNVAAREAGVSPRDAAANRDGGDEPAARPDAQLVRK